MEQDGVERIRSLITGSLDDDIYQLGHERTVADWCDYVGVNLDTLTACDRAYLGLAPDLDNKEWHAKHGNMKTLLNPSVRSTIHKTGMDKPSGWTNQLLKSGLLSDATPKIPFVSSFSSPSSSSSSLLQSTTVTAAAVASRKQPNFAGASNTPASNTSAASISDFQRISKSTIRNMKQFQRPPPVFSNMYSMK